MRVMMQLFRGFLLFCLMIYTNAQTIKILSIVDESLSEAPSWLEEGVSKSQTESGVTLTNTVVRVSIEDETEAEEQFCQALYDAVAMIVDITAGGWSYGKEKASEFGIPYLHSQVSIYQWMSATDQLLRSRNATDAALIFNNDAQLDQGLYYLVEGSVVRVIVLAGIQSNTTDTLKKMRPAPAHYVIFAPAVQLQQMFDKAVRSGLVSRDSRWTLVMTSQESSPLQRDLIPGATMITLMIPRDSLCCAAMRTSTPCSCDSVDIPKEFTINTIQTATKALKESGLKNQKSECNKPSPQPSSTDSFYTAIQEQLRLWPGVNWNAEKMQILPELVLDIHTMNSTSNIEVGEWSTSKGLSLEATFKNTPIKRFFKVGAIKSRPWTYDKLNQPRNADEMYEGYCVELTEKLAEHMNFDYEFIFPPDGKYGAKEKNGSWNGLVGDLTVGETDIIVAPLTMTSEREEVIDFVAPYFDQSGISIVIRKKEREESLFKFMTVLKAEVWVSIVAALVVTGIMIWFLDKYSPYSAQNNVDLQLQPYRKFTLKESFWFALTSFTPQGGGEAPKALSGRTLVAAYWLFVVLMLATFTANLAAFLTVERMQSSVQSLEALAKQAKITFTTSKDNSIFEYFDNMAKAEDELFRVWKELTLNSTSDQSKYRVWDYPIKEQYTHILQVIEETGPLDTVDEGLQKVKDSNGEFAFIHDAAELRYEVYHDCYLTEVGEPFAEQPYAIAVQQGSHLQDEISKTILELQKDRYFEALTAKYWNSSARGYCPNDDDSEGINLKSLGGVFIATLIGLVLALIALAVEVMYYRRIPEDDKNTPRKVKNFTTKSSISRIKVSPAF